MIIAIKENDKVIVGYSNADSWGCLSEKDYIDEENIAIGFSEDGKLFAFTNTDRISDALLYEEDFLNKEVTFKSIIREIIPYIKEKLENYKVYDEIEHWNNSLIICESDKLFDIDPSFGFYEADDYVCHGYNVETLKSVLDETIGIPAEERIMKAVIFSCKLHNDVLFPIVIVDSKSRKCKYIFEGEKRYECIDCVQKR